MSTKQANKTNRIGKSKKEEKEEEKNDKHKYQKYKTKYLTNQLLNDLSSYNTPKILQKEILDWITVFRVLRAKYSNIKIYLKGGSVLGLQVYKLSKNFNLVNFLRFYQLGLVRDWDFVIHANAEAPPEVKGKCKLGLYDEIINVITNKNKFRSEGSNTCIVRHKNKTEINNEEALLESAIVIKKKFTTLSAIEIPLTAMYGEITNKLYHDFFRVVCIFRLFENFDFEKNPYYKELLNKPSKETQIKFVSQYKNYDLLNLISIINKFVKSLNIIIIPSIQGYPEIKDVKDLDYGIMEEYKHVFDSFECNLSEKQFLLCQHINSMRLVRLYGKNIPKSNKIKNYLKDNHLSTVSWLLDEKSTVKLLERFEEHLYSLLFKKYFDALNANPNNNTVINLFTVLDEFFSKTLILVVYNTLIKERNKEDNKKGYDTFVNAVKIAFKRYIPKATLSSIIYTKENEKQLEINKQPNYTFKLFSSI